MIINKVTKNLNNARTQLYLQIEKVTDKILSNIYLNENDISLKLDGINELIYDMLMNNSLNELSKITTIDTLININENIITINYVTLEEIQEIWSIIKNEQVEKYIHNSNEFQKTTSIMIAAYIPYCTAKLYLESNTCEWNLKSIHTLKSNAQKCNQLYNNKKFLMIFQ